MSTTTNPFRTLAVLAVVLALCVVMLGAYVRLSDAGLGCPDWPGCYGHLLVPAAEHEVAAANEAYPHRPVEGGKAWREVTHRIAAGILGLLILALAVIAWRHRHRPGQPVVVPLLLVALVVFQALLGMWTVTLQLKPLIVMGHLLGGLAIVALLWWLALTQFRWPARLAERSRRFAGWAALALVLVVGQVALGGWTSANYAALACPDFPTCQTRWWPPMDFDEAFVLWRGLGVNYEFGVLDNDARVAIHMTHRMGALVVTLVVGALAVALLAGTGRRKWLGGALLAVLATQVLLGIANIVLTLPLPVAVAHNGVAALLILALVTINHALRAREPSP